MDQPFENEYDYVQTSTNQVPRTIIPLHFKARRPGANTNDKSSRPGPWRRPVEVGVFKTRDSSYYQKSENIFDGLKIEK